MTESLCGRMRGVLLRSACAQMRADFKYVSQLSTAVGCHVPQTAHGWTKAPIAVPPHPGSATTPHTRILVRMAPRRASVAWLAAAALVACVSGAAASATVLTTNTVLQQTGECCCHTHTATRGEWQACAPPFAHSDVSCLRGARASSASSLPFSLTRRCGAQTRVCGARGSTRQPPTCTHT